MVIQGVDVNIGAGKSITPVDTGHGSSLASYSLELPGTYRIKVTYCKDLKKVRAVVYCLSGLRARAWRGTGSS